MSSKVKTKNGKGLKDERIRIPPGHVFIKQTNANVKCHCRKSLENRLLDLEERGRLKGISSLCLLLIEGETSWKL